MSAAPEYHRARLAPLPRLPLSAILGFSVAGFGGALFLAYSTFNAPETNDSLASTKAAPVYEARAVPLDPRPEDDATRGTSIARALIALPSESQQRTETSEADLALESESTFLSGSDGELQGFSRFAHSAPTNSYLAVTGTTFGMSAHMAPSGISATDAETSISAVVPEASTWLCGVALLALVVARGLHASWHRHQRRSANKTDSTH